MDSEEATRICGQCNKEVAEANFALHETHCTRFLCLCPECDEAVPKDQLKEHREEQHTLVRCSKCNEKMEQCRLQDHELWPLTDCDSVPPQWDECQHRLQGCEFCELEVPVKDLDEHRLVCGSRTELCRDCSRYVKLTDLAEHRLICLAADNSSSPPPGTSSVLHSTKTTVSCTGCKASFSAEDIDKHTMGCFLAAKWDSEKVEPEQEESEDDSEDDRDSSGQEDAPQLRNATALTNTFNQKPSMNEGDPDKLSTCPFCHLALPVSTLRWHEAKCHIHIVLKQK
ncbi:XIAP-associated factor 1-like isoform X2 [Cololabis saira]|uniref:XIAP-associated factor 1-like isoform X2 n=1 Tax=Cololabis saira TaxID=129043 RepID=UPI002AD581BE|nr:XIAP-associated factor 1-like isoform X2 [Cololabis saira]